MLVADFEIIITKSFSAALILSPFGFYGDILKLVYTTSSCGAMVSATSRKPATSQGSKFAVAAVASATMFCHLLAEYSSGSKHLLLP